MLVACVIGSFLYYDFHKIVAYSVVEGEKSALKETREVTPLPPLETHMLRETKEVTALPLIETCQDLIHVNQFDSKSCERLGEDPYPGKMHKPLPTGLNCSLAIIAAGSARLWEHQPMV